MTLRTLFAVTMLTGTLAAQSRRATDEQTAPLLQLSAGEVVRFDSLPSGVIVNPVKCDERGAVYFRQYKRGDVSGSPIIQLDVRDKKSQVFNVRNISEKSISNPASLRIEDFTPSGRNLYVAVVDENDAAYVLTFSLNDAGYLGAVPIEKNFFPLNVAVFPTGDMILSGTAKKNPADPQSPLNPVTAICDNKGRFVSHVKLPDDLRLQDVKGKNDESAFQSLTTSLMQSSGTFAYLLRPAEDPILYAVLPDGTADSKKVLKSPGKLFTPVNFRIAAPYAIVQYVHDPINDGKTNRFVQYDLNSGEVLSIASPDENLLGAFACYDPSRNEYTFLLNSGGHVALQSASLR